MKRVVILTASPKKNGNSALAADLLEACLKEQGAETVRFDTAFMKLGGCRDCRNCNKNGKYCIFDNDDFNRTAAELVKADAIVITTPVYWYTFPEQIKGLIDRFFCLLKGGHTFEGKKTALISFCGDNEEDTFDGMVFSFRKTMALMRAENAGELLYPGVYGPGEAANTSIKDDVKALADKLLA